MSSDRRVARVGVFLRKLGFVIAAALGACASVASEPPIEPYDSSDDVFYHFMPIAWRDSDNDEFRYGDFDGMTASLDYLQQLGVTAVWMNPIHPSPAYHGYQHGPIDQVNPWFGDEAKFLNFVAQAKARQIRVYLDLVVYGISQNSVYFKGARGQPESEYASWLAFTNDAKTQFTGYDFKTWTGATVGFVNWDLRNPPNGTGLARKQVIEWCKHWLDPNHDGDPSDGVAGYRLDHVWEKYNQGPDGWGYNVDDFWREWKAALQSVNPSVFTFVEQAAWESTGADLLAVHDASFTKPFEFAARDALRAERAEKLYSAMGNAVASQPKERTFLGIIGDHDVDRLTSAIGADKAETAGRAKAAAAVLMLQPFAPIMYYGDELGMLGKKADYGGDANDIPMREPMKWNAVAGAPMTNYFAQSATAYGKRLSRDHDGRSVEEQAGVAGSLLETYRSLIRVRRESVALRRGEYTPIPASDPAVWSFVRGTAEQTVLVTINLSGKAVTVSVDLSRQLNADGFVLDDLPGAASADAVVVSAADRRAVSVVVGPYGYRALSIPSAGALR